MEEGCVLISRKGSSSSGVGGHALLEEGCILIARRGHTFTGQRLHFDLEGSATSTGGAYLKQWNGASSCR